VRRRRILLLFALSRDNETLAYQRGWVRKFLEHPRFECVPVDVRSHRAALPFRLAGVRRLEAAVLLHSVFSNEQRLRGPLLGAVARLRVPKAFFVGNEYKLMPEKVAFSERIGVDLLVSQISGPEAHELYAQRLGCRVIGIPSGGLDEELFRPRTPRAQRPVDLGYRAYDAPYTLGNRERQIIGVDVLRRLAGRGLALDVSLASVDRLDERGWAQFLDRCKGQLGSEAGGDYFELTDETRLRVNEFQLQHPDATFEETFDRFFREYEQPISGRALSGRIVEAAGMKSAQILFEGEYGGYFHPDVHYIPLRRDLSNLDEAVARLLDLEEADRIAEAAYEVARTQLTYDRLIDRFADALDEALAR
jgi:spore maturation protein CgeB